MFDNLETIASVVIGSAIALAPLFLGPLLVGEYITSFDISESSAGLILSAEMSAFTLGSATIFAILKQNWRKIVATAITLMVIGNAAFLVAEGLWISVFLRLVAGFGSGMAMTMTIQIVGQMRNPDQIYGLWSVGQLSLGALGLYFFPTLIALGGIKALFSVLALLAMLMAFTLQFYPIGRESTPGTDHRHTTPRQLTLGLLCLLGLFLYYGAQAGVWAYMELIGTSWNLERKLVSQILFASLIAAIFGSGLAVMLSNRVGRTVPILAALLISAVSIMMLIQPAGMVRFAVAACLFNFAWYLFLPYISAVLAVVDENGRILTGFAVTTPMSLAAGPAIAALLIAETHTLASCLIFGLSSIPLGLILMFPATRLQSIR